MNQRTHSHKQVQIVYVQYYRLSFIFYALIFQTVWRGSLEDIYQLVIGLGIGTINMGEVNQDSLKLQLFLALPFHLCYFTLPYFPLFCFIFRVFFFFYTIQIFLCFSLLIFFLLNHTQMYFYVLTNFFFIPISTYTPLW